MLIRRVDLDIFIYFLFAWSPIIVKLQLVCLTGHGICQGIIFPPRFKCAVCFDNKWTEFGLQDSLWLGPSVMERPCRWILKTISSIASVPNPPSPFIFLQKKLMIHVVFLSLLYWPYRRNALPYQKSSQLNCTLYLINVLHFNLIPGYFPLIGTDGRY